jgi:hypothetical protein
MYGLPTDFDPSFLKGIDLFQVCVGEHQVQMHFDKEVLLSIESSFRIQLADGEAQLYEDCRSSAGALAALVSDKTADAAAQPNGTLRLTFASGRWIEIYDDSQQYESYQIHRGQTLYVV